MSHAEMADLAGCKERTIKKWCVEKHHLRTWDRAKLKTLSPLQHDLIIGSILGDGHIDRREKYPLFIVCHAENQKDYLYYKYEILKDLCRMKPTMYNGLDRVVINGSICKTQNTYRFNTGTYMCLNTYRKMSMAQIADALNEYSFSIWILDDGCRCDDGYWQLCVAAYTEDEKKKLKEVLRQKFQIIAHPKKDIRYWNFWAEDSRKIDSIILRNIPNNLDIIQYKILRHKKDVA